MTGMETAVVVLAAAGYVLGAGVLVVGGVRFVLSRVAALADHLEAEEATE